MQSALVSQIWVFRMHLPLPHRNSLSLHGRDVPPQDLSVSSLLSPQSLSPSQRNLFGMHFLLEEHWKSPTALHGGQLFGSYWKKLLAFKFISIRHTLQITSSELSWQSSCPLQKAHSGIQRYEAAHLLQPRGHCFLRQIPIGSSLPSAQSLSLSQYQAIGMHLPLLQANCSSVQLALKQSEGSSSLLSPEINVQFLISSRYY